MSLNQDFQPKQRTVSRETFFSAQNLVPGPSLVWSFEACLNFECPSTECGPEHGPVVRTVLGPEVQKVY